MRVLLSDIGAQKKASRLARLCELVAESGQLPYVRRCATVDLAGGGKWTG